MGNALLSQGDNLRWAGLLTRVVRWMLLEYSVKVCVYIDRLTVLHILPALLLLYLSCKYYTTPKQCLHS